MGRRAANADVGRNEYVRREACDAVEAVQPGGGPVASDSTGHDELDADHRRPLVEHVHDRPRAPAEPADPAVAFGPPQPPAVGADAVGLHGAERRVLLLREPADLVPDAHPRSLPTGCDSHV